MFGFTSPNIQPQNTTGILAPLQVYQFEAH